MGKDGTHISKNNVFIGNSASSNKNGDWSSGGPTKTSGDYWAHNTPKVSFSTSKSPAPGVLEAAKSTMSAVGVPQAEIDAFARAVGS